ncbi:MAG TPA: valine--tRNA ligase [Bryobacteraceae bacterium]|jgi:valyl-tRNA synthetase|nr:valine--tRNA ligase [Bryobacteraceae bacterium]
MLLEKAYEPQKFEPHWAQWWIETGLYRPERRPGHAGVFSIVIPPPNVTGSLHIGHMLEHTVMDVAVRWHRMKGETTLWVPGNDHAGIATQMVVERELAAQGLNRRQLGREEFERRVWQWKEEYGGRINNQIRREGASVDWSRERFTMDPGLSRAVREAFVRLWDKGLIYRGEYMVNWCPRCQTAISDVETVHESESGNLWHIRYAVKDSDESLVVATTRPETMLGDTALAVHPEDPRYLHLHGKTAILPLIHREIRIIADVIVDPKFGTGVVKITPAHDPNDFEVGKRHSLPSVKVIDEDARMTAAAGQYQGLDRFEARKRIVAALEASGELVKTEPYTVNLSKCSRCKTIIEPLVSNQWFVRMRGLADAAMDAVRSGRIRFVPDDREVVFFQWMENIRDWCISRQLWWGHRIPAWHCHNCKQTTVAREAPAICPHCQSTELEQDNDVLDTWFSSGLWPFSTLGWPDETEDLKKYYPTSLLITGFDILFFWVSRMMMLGLEMTGDVPFREVHLHGLVRDAEKQKISKTKGNTVDPLLMMDKYGTDACRIGLLISASAGADIALKDDRLEASRAFANKLWNASRLLFLNIERSKLSSWPSGPFPHEHFEDAWIHARLNEATASVNAALRSHRYHEAAQTLWNFVWHEFCDWYLEVKKLRFKEDSGPDAHWTAALTIYEGMLRLLHPFMPFITEELWQRLVHALPSLSKPVESISLAAFPAAIAEKIPATEFPVFQQAVTAARELRADNKLDAKAILPATIHVHGKLFKDEDLAIIKSLTRLEVRQIQGTISERSGLIRSTPDFDLQIQAAAPSTNGTVGAESVARISKEVAALERNIENSKRQLSDETFLSRAPEKVVAGLRTKLVEYEAQLKKNRDLLEGLG